MQKQNECQLNISFAEKFSIKSKEYANTPVRSLSLSVRAINCFMSNGISTLESLLDSTPQSLLELKGFGRTCLEEVENFCSKLTNKNIESLPKSKKDIHGLSAFRPYYKSIALGDFSFSDKLSLSDSENETLIMLKETFNLLGEDLSFDCIMAPEKILPIINMLNAFQNEMQRHFVIRKLVEKLPKGRKTNRAFPYINAFTLNDNERNTLMDLCSSENTTITEMATASTLETDKVYLLFVQFLKWCSFNLRAEIEDLFANIYKNNRNCFVIQGRARKKTLEQIGLELGITRERVRQIEAKTKRAFAHYCSRIRIISKISAERNGDTVLTPLEVEEYCGQDVQELIFLLSTYDNTNYTYDRQLDLFVIGNNSIQDQVTQYVENLPDVVRADKLPEILKDANEDEDIPTEMLEKAFLNAYRLTGTLYHRHRLSLASVYEKILEKYYPDGLKVYDADEIKKFRELVAFEYGDIELPQNNRALSARIASTCVLCGRGIYKLKQKQYISKDLSNRIHEYIIDCNTPILLTNTLFSVFEDELAEAGINNKYYLQGVLRELFSEEFTFSRDYISKDPNITSVYSSIVEFIKQFEYPISKAMVQKEFPGVTDIVISFAISDSNVLNYFGEYLHASHLRLSESEKSYLYDLLCTLLDDGQAHHSKDIYEIINREKPEILKRNASLYQYSTFSILEYLFNDKFQFSRPYIAKNGVNIGRPAERLHDLIYSADEFEVSEISEFAKENRYQIQSILELINECNDEYLLINASTMKKIESIGITKEMAETIDKLVADEITTTTPIFKLQIWDRFPQINVSWTDWLLYSTLNKWGRKVSVSTSSNQFRMAVPLVAPIGKMNTVAFADVVPSKDNHVKIDNLDDIDSLLEDILADDILEKKYEL